MKKILLSICAVAISFFGISQDINVTESTEIIGGGANNAFSVIVYETNKSEVLKQWKSSLKTHDAKVKTDKKGAFADNASIASISENTIDVYATVEETGNTVKLTVAFDLGGAYLSSEQHAEKVTAAKTFVRDFAYKVTKVGLQQIVTVEEEATEGLEKKQEKLVKQNKNLKQTIEDAKKLIVTSEKNLEQNEKDQIDNQKALDLQKKKQEAAKQRLADF